MESIDTIKNKHILVRVDFDVTIYADGTVSDEMRIIKNIKTITQLVEQGNVVLAIAKRGRPKGRDLSLSLKPIADILPHYIPGYSVTFIPDHTKTNKEDFVYTPNHFYLLENLRFYDGEKSVETDYVSQLASLGDVYVNDCFSMSHRTEASITQLPKFLPSYMGFQLKNEIDAISPIIHEPQKPYVVIMGGAKLETKVDLLRKMLEKADMILVGGVLANTFIKSQGYTIGKSIYDENYLDKAKEIMIYAQSQNKKLMLPLDVQIASDKNSLTSSSCNLNEIPTDAYIVDIGPQTQELFSKEIMKAKTILWNGPMGYTENPHFLTGTESILKAISHNPSSLSIVGGGDTIGALSHNPLCKTIDHISTGGGALLTYIEKGTLVGLDALNH